MTITLTALQKQRRDTAANWTAENPTLLAGEIGIESDTGKIKIGTGAAAWNSLAYQGIIPSSGAYPLSQLIMPLGTAAAPAVTFTGGDVNTGIYSPGADQVAISTGGTGRLFVDSSGRVGVNNPSPGQRLHVYDASASNVFTRVSNASAGYLDLGVLSDGSIYGPYSSPVAGTVLVTGTATNTPFLFYTNGSERLRITSAGLVGIGASSISEQLQLGQNGSGTDNYIGIWGDQSGSNGEFAGIKFFNNQANASSTPVKQVASIYAARDGDNFGGALYFQTANPSSGSQTLGTRMLLDSSGRLGIGSTSPDYTLNVQGTVGIGKVGTSGTYNLFWAPNTVAQQVKWIRNNSGELSIGAGTTAGSSEQMRLDDQGRLLVGTSSALDTDNVVPKIQSADAGNQAGFGAFRYSNTSPGPIIHLFKSRGTSVGANTIVQDGDVLGEIRFVGADGTNEILGAKINGEVDGTPGANDMPGRLVFSTCPDGSASPVERMRISSTGRIRIGSETLAFDDNAVFNVFNSSTKYGISVRDYYNTTQLILFTNSTGGTVGSITQSGSATAYNTSSDYRLKENVTAVTDGITRLQQLKPSRFNFIADPSKTVDGFLAHEAAEVVPECVTGEKDAVDDEGNPIYQGIDQSKLVPLLTAALQEAIAKIESLEARITALEA